MGRNVRLRIRFDVYAMTKNKCTCDEHDCEIKDDYTKDGYMCEQCFMDCVEMENE